SVERHDPQRAGELLAPLVDEVEFHALPDPKGAQAAALDRGRVDVDLRPVVHEQDARAGLVVELADGSLGHVPPPGYAVRCRRVTTSISRHTCLALPGRSADRSVRISSGPSRSNASSGRSTTETGRSRSAAAS